MAVRDGIAVVIISMLAGLAPAAPPNIILILADDMGFSDIGPYGGEIRTPNLDKMASEGLKFTQFYNNARCCPTRASLLTGQYSHRVGIGHMNVDERATAGPGYRGGLIPACATLAEVLKPAGYSTYMLGKWHVASEGTLDRPGSGQWPLDRGFDHYFGRLLSQPQYFRTTGIWSDDKPVPTDGTFYYTQALADSAVARIRRHAAEKSNPFFMYLAFSAPHFPLQALQADIDRYRDRYRKGWDSLRAERYRRQVASGLIDPAWKLSPADGADWGALAPKKREEMELRMAIYAAQIDRLDQGVGRVMGALEANGLGDNTLVLFLSDNGGNAEGGDYGGGPAGDLGRDSTEPFLTYGKSWGNASNTPFRKFKHFDHEGGISTPFLARWPAGISRKGAWEASPSHLIDVMPTLAEVAGAAYPAQRAGLPIPPMAGRSLAPLFRGEPAPRAAPLFWEHEGNRAVRQGKWKLVRTEGSAWELYDLEKDRVEANDLAKANPARVRSLDSLWSKWADANFVRRDGSVGLAPARAGLRDGSAAPAASDALGRPARTGSERRTWFPIPAP